MPNILLSLFIFHISVFLRTNHTSLLCFFFFFIWRNYQLRSVIDAWISSKVRPFVSGTNFTTNTMIKLHTAANTKKTPGKGIMQQFIRWDASCITANWHSKHELALLPAELHWNKKLNAYVTIQELNQFPNVTRLPPVPFMFIGKIWRSNNFMS